MYCITFESILFYSVLFFLNSTISENILLLVQVRHESDCRLQIVKLRWGVNRQTGLYFRTHPRTGEIKNVIETQELNFKTKLPYLKGKKSYIY